MWEWYRFDRLPQRLLFRQREVLHDEIVCVNCVVMDDHTTTATFFALR